MIRIVRAREGRETAWRNGGGATVEIAVHPPGAGLDDFAWRVSRARIAADGPFSTYPGIDRSLVCLQGGGVELRCAEGAVMVRTGGEPVTFPGERAVDAHLAAAPVTVLNVMTRRGQAVHRLTGLRLEGAAELPPGAIMLVSCAAGIVNLGRHGTLEAGDTAQLADEAPTALTGEATLWVVAIDFR